MGRTNATYRNHLDAFISSFEPFKKGLRKQNKTHLNSLWEKAHSFASAAAYMNSSKPGLPVTISIMLGLQKEIDENTQEIRKIQERLEKIENE